MNQLIFFIFLLEILNAQIEPVKGIHTNTPRVWALTHGMVHTSPGDFIKDATIIIRDGKIDKVGRYVKVPSDAFQIDLNDANVYPGFIDSWLEIKYDKKTTSPDEHWNSKVRASYRAKDDLKFKDKDIKALHSIGFTTAHIVPQKGIFKGQSDLVTISDKPVSISESVSQVVEFMSGKWSDREYPNSLLGTIALIRQTFLDADWYAKSREITLKFPAENEPLDKNYSLESLYNFKSTNRPVLFHTKNEHSALRALNISDEFNLKPWLLGSGYEYRRLAEISKHNPFIILPMDLPAKPKISDPNIALQYTTEQLKHWDMAPENFSKIQDAGIFFSLSSHGLKKKSVQNKSSTYY